MATKQEEIANIKARSPYCLPDNPAAEGWSTAQIKAKFYEGLLYLHELLDDFREEGRAEHTELSEDVTTALNNINGIINGTLSAAKATGDVDGNAIKTTYAKIADITSGSIAALKYVKQDGTTDTIYSILTALNNLSSLYNAFVSTNFTNGKANEALLSEKANKDINGNVINTTYATKAENTATNAEITKIKSGATIVGAANKDKDGKQIDTTYEKVARKGVAGGYAPLNENGLVPTQYLPDSLDDIVEYASLSNFPATGSSGKIYVALDTNLRYVWSGTQYTQFQGGLQIGIDAGTAFEGSRGYAVETGLTAHKAASNPHNITKETIELGNVDNTSDLSKPISTATQTALNSKLDKVYTANRVYGTDAEGNQTTYDKEAFGQVDDVQAEGVSVVSNKVANVTKNSLGLGNVDNTSDINKPISTATQSALDLKQNSLSSTQLSAVNSGIDATKVAQIETNKQNILTKQDNIYFSIVNGKLCITYNQ